MVVAAGTSWNAARDKLRRKLWRTSDGIPDDECDMALHAALLEIESARRWAWLDNISTRTILDGPDEKVSLDPYAASVQTVAYLSSSNNYEKLMRAQLADVRQARTESGDTQGVPLAYALQSNNVSGIPSGIDVMLDTLVAENSEFEIVVKVQTPRDLETAIYYTTTQFAAGPNLYDQDGWVLANDPPHTAVTINPDGSVTYEGDEGLGFTRNTASAPGIEVGKVYTVTFIFFRFSGLFQVTFGGVALGFFSESGEFAQRVMAVTTEGLAIRRANGVGSAIFNNIGYHADTDYRLNVTLNRETEAVVTLAAYYACMGFLKDEENAGRQREAYDRHLARMMDEEDEFRSDLTGGLIQPDTYYAEAAFGRGVRPFV